MSLRAAVRCAAAGVALTLAACATKVEVAETRFQQVRDVSRAMSLEVSKRFASPVPGITLPQGLGLTRPVLVGGFPQASTAETMVSGHQLRDLLLLDLRQQMSAARVVRLEDAGNLSGALMLNGVVRYQPESEQGVEANWFVIDYAVRTYPEAELLMSGSALVNARHFDPTPTRFFKDAPMYFAADQRTDLVALASSGKADPDIQRALKRSLAYESARGAYDREDFELAARRFDEILAADRGDDLLALSGKFQSLWKLGRQQEAEESFGRLVDAAIAHEALSIKFLFQVGQEDFERGQELYRQYPLWIRQLARGMRASGRCFEIKGHSSHSGTAEYNDRLSTARARRVMRYLQSAEPALAERVTAKGYGFRENIIGSGTDDARDAIDRRVDFAETPCRNSG